MAQLSGTGRIADDLYLMAHHEVTGKPQLQPRAVGLGLAGALLAELMAAGKVQIKLDALVVTDPSPPADELGSQVLDQVLGEDDQHAVRDWLAFLARNAAADVAARLVQAGYLTRPSGRRLLGPQRWVPVDPDCAFVPFARVHSALDPYQPMTVSGALLAGLAAACGLGPRVLEHGPAQGRLRLDEAVGRLRPDLRDLISQTQAAVDSAVLSQRV